jgi:hypothetical protein
MVVPFFFPLLKRLRLLRARELNKFALIEISLVEMILNRPEQRKITSVWKKEGTRSFVLDADSADSRLQC